MKAKVTVTSVAIATTRFLFGMYDCTVDGDIGIGSFSLVQRSLHVFGHTYVRSHVSPGMA